MNLSRRHFLAALPAAGLPAAGLLSAPAIGQDRVAMATTAAAKRHALAPAIRVAMKAQAAAAALTDYSATFVKRERVGGRLVEGRMLLKLRHAPKSIYLKFITPHEGRELIFVDGRNGGNMLVHETGLASLVGTLSIDPTGSMALRESRRPVTDIGIANMAEKVVRQWVIETDLPEPTVKYFPNAKIGSTACKVVEITRDRPHPKLLAQRSRFYVTKATGLPIRVQQYDFNPAGSGPPVLAEDYAYADLRENVGLADLDFDVKNPAYGY